ncbi:hypothetical protein ABIB62_004756 [Mucilaginibacter sp. UYP25]|uniref:hypothetical protein n=1 Tax=unclassified Mucilaginibacter TaxID=2617802 RepID=UPI003397DCCC
MIRINKLFNCQLILVILFCGSCNTNISTKQKLIAGSDYKLWQEIKDTTRHKGSSITYWYFDKKGKSRLYIKYKNASKIVRLDLGDIVLNEYWNLAEGGKVDIGGKIYKIDVLNDTCFSFRDTTKSQETKLVYKNDKIL